MEILDYLARLDQLSALINQTRPDYQQDLKKMLANLRKTYLRLQVAAIECRRLHTVTASYSSLALQFDAEYSEIEQMTTLALLI